MTNTSNIVRAAALPSAPCRPAAHRGAFNNTFAQPHRAGQNMETPLDAIIVGAGAAGVGAAATFQAGGLTASYIVLEATVSLQAPNHCSTHCGLTAFHPSACCDGPSQDRVGGRVKAFSFGESPQIVLENGANWVSGSGPPPHWPHKAVNPMFKLALALNLSMVRVPGSATNMSNWAASDERGQWSDTDFARRRLANRVQGCVAQKGAVSGANLSAAAAAALCGWRSKDGLDRALEWQLFTGETGLPPQQMSAMGYLPDPTYDDFGADDFFVYDQHPRGFSRVLDAVSRGALDGGRHALDRSHLVLGARVVRIAYTCDGVEVTASDGRKWRARYLISTLPLGVLQRAAESLFAPPLPHAQAAAMRAIPMTNYTKIFAQWAAPWWDVSVYKWAQSNEGFNGGELGSVRNLAHPSVLPHSNTLLFDLGEPQASTWEGLTDAAAQARLLKRLRDTHPTKDIPPPVAFHISRHSRDPLSYGAYSAWGTSTMHDHAKAAAPLAASSAVSRTSAAGSAPNARRLEEASAAEAPPACPSRVFLSGEAFCPNYNGFVQYASTLRLKSSRRCRTRPSLLSPFSLLSLVAEPSPSSNYSSLTHAHRFEHSRVRSGGLLAGRRDARQVLHALGRAPPAVLPGEGVAWGCDVETTRLRATPEPPVPGPVPAPVPVPATPGAAA